MIKDEYIMYYAYQYKVSLFLIDLVVAFVFVSIYACISVFFSVATVSR